MEPLHSDITVQAQIQIMCYFRKYEKFQLFLLKNGSKENPFSRQFSLTEQKVN